MGKDHLHITITWAPEGKRKRGPPQETWRRTVERERKKKGFNTWNDTAADRVAWIHQVIGPILHAERRN